MIFFKKIKIYIRRLLRGVRTWRLFKKAKKQLHLSYEEQLKERKKLRKDINVFLKKYFGIDANSKFIPKDYKSKEEVKAAIQEKFSGRMSALNLKISDLYD